MEKYKKNPSEATTCTTTHFFCATCKCTNTNNFMMQTIINFHCFKFSCCPFESFNNFKIGAKALNQNWSKSITLHPECFWLLHLTQFSCQPLYWQSLIQQQRAVISGSGNNWIDFSMLQWDLMWSSHCYIIVPNASDLVHFLCLFF